MTMHCPFCANDECEVVCEELKNDMRQAYVHCEQCGAKGPVKKTYGDEYVSRLAEEAWETRYVRAS